MVDLIVGIVFGVPLLGIVWVLVFPAQHYADGDPTPRHRASCRQCRRGAHIGRSAES